MKEGSKGRLGHWLYSVDSNPLFISPFIRWRNCSAIAAIPVVQNNSMVE
jgi:hypothetical protein